MTTQRDAEDMLLRSADRFIAACERIPKEKWLVKPAKGGWSAGEVIEHVAIVNQRMSGVFERVVPLDGSPLAFHDEEIPFAFYGGDEPPGVADPTGEWVDIPDAFGKFRASIDAIREKAAASTTDLRTVGSPHLVFGMLDGVQWLLFGFAHTERHRGDLRALARQFAG